MRISWIANFIALGFVCFVLWSMLKVLAPPGILDMISAHAGEIIGLGIILYALNKVFSGRSRGGGTWTGGCGEGAPKSPCTEPCNTCSDR